MLSFWNKGKNQNIVYVSLVTDESLFLNNKIVTVIVLGVDIPLLCIGILTIAAIHTISAWY